MSLITSFIPEQTINEWQFYGGARLSCCSKTWVLRDPTNSEKLFNDYPLYKKIVIQYLIDKCPALISENCPVNEFREVFEDFTSNKCDDEVKALIKEVQNFDCIKRSYPKEFDKSKFRLDVLCTEDIEIAFDETLFEPIKINVELYKIENLIQKSLAAVESMLTWSVDIRRVNISSGLQNSAGTSKTFNKNDDHELVKVLKNNPRNKFFEEISKKKLNIFTKNESPLSSYFYKPKKIKESIPKTVAGIIAKGKTAVVQEKLNGVRCYATVDNNGGVKLTSRHNKEIQLPYLNPKLSRFARHLRNISGLQKNVIFDGELYNENMHVNVLAGFINTKEKHCSCNNVHCYLNFSSARTKNMSCQDIPSYYVFDYNAKHRDLTLRLEDISEVVKQTRVDLIKAIPKERNYVCENPEDAQETFDEIAKLELEGIVIKEAGLLPAKDLECYKAKSVFDDRYLCIGVKWTESTNSTGPKSPSCVLILNGTPRDTNTNPVKTFKSTYTQTKDKLRELKENDFVFIGKFFNIEFNQKTVYGLPFQSTAHDIV